MVNTTRKRNWQDTLGARDKLTIAFKTEFAQIYGDTEGTYRRFYRSEEGGQAIKALRKKFKRMLGGEVDASRHLAFIAATDQNVMQRDWRVENDSLAQQVCTRGPARMTWRQAVNLNLNGGFLLSMHSSPPTNLRTQSRATRKRARFLVTPFEAWWTRCGWIQRTLPL